MRALAASTLALIIAAGCSTDVGSDESFQRDGFNTPTLHGAMDFEEPMLANFTATQRFHAWTVKLDDEAELVLETDNLSTNVDTVMYLYAADANDRRVGSYLKKNDDHDGELASRISKKLDAGKYIVIVKAHKTQIRGSFTLQASCSGDGCPEPELPPTFEEMCDGIDDGVADCVYEQSPLEDCAPKDDPDALMCCNARNDNYCSVTCEGGPEWLEGDLDYIYELGDGDYTSVYDYSALVYPACGGTTFDDLIESARNSGSDIADQWGEYFEDWGEGTKVTRDGINSGLMYGGSWALEEMDAAAKDDHCVGWYSTVEVPCPNCTNHVEKWLIYYPNTGVAFEIEGSWGYDS